MHPAQFANGSAPHPASDLEHWHHRQTRTLDRESGGPRTAGGAFKFPPSREVLRVLTMVLRRRKNSRDAPDFGPWKLLQHTQACSVEVNAKILAGPKKKNLAEHCHWAAGAGSAASSGGTPSSLRPVVNITSRYPGAHGLHPRLGGPAEVLVREDQRRTPGRNFRGRPGKTPFGGKCHSVRGVPFFEKVV
jgi:hypothetical protein